MASKIAKPFVPSLRVFTNTCGLDHRLWDANEQLKPDVRRYVIQSVNTMWAFKYQDWSQWARVYFAGSEASEWTSPTLEGNGDFDILIGVNYDKFRELNPDYKDWDNQKITDEMNQGFRAFNGPVMLTIDGIQTGPWDRTTYVNPDSYDIRAIRPYAAYDVGKSAWVVRPPHLPHWSLSELPGAVQKVLRATDRLARDVLKLPEPERTQQGAALFDAWHTDRSRAFSPNGEGWYDIANLREKWLDQAGLWAEIVNCKHRFNQGLGAAPTDWSNTPMGYIALLSPDKAEGLAEIGHQEHPNVDHYRSGGIGHIDGDESRSVVGFMPVKHMLPYRDHDGTRDGEDSERRINAIREDIRSGVGIKNPIIVHYSDKDKWGYIGEGNHRLEAAHREGLQTIPVRVGRDHDLSSVRDSGRGAHMDLRGKFDEDRPGGKYPYVPSDIHPHHFFHEATVHEAMPWFDDGTVSKPRPKSVRRAGFKGLVGNSAWDKNEKHDAEIPDHVDDHLSHFAKMHAEHPSAWVHAKRGPVDIRQGVYATQTHVSQWHVDRYRKNPEDRVWAMQGDDPNEQHEYVGHHDPLFVTHQGRLHAIDGHHRIAAGIQDQSSHVLGLHLDLDKHPTVVNSNGDECPTCKSLHASEHPAEQRTASRAGDLYGKGINALFKPDEDGPPSAVPTPFPGAKQSKTKKTFDSDLVARSITHPQEFSVEKVDPRELHSTQPSVTHAGVKHYMEGGVEYGKNNGGDRRLGNDIPRIYHRLDDDHKMILSGHHRATSALLKGEPLDAIVIKGPWGHPRG